MENIEHPLQFLAPAGFALAPIQSGTGGSYLPICILVRKTADPAESPFVLLRELPGSRVYLGAVCDAEARIQEWVEIWVQTLDLRDLNYSSHHEQLANHTFDQRWRSEFTQNLKQLPETIILTGAETVNPSPLLIHRMAASHQGFAVVETCPWKLCKDDALLDSLGLPLYSTSPFRYLYQPESAGPKTFLAAAPDAPTNAHVQSIDRLKDGAETADVLNPHAGLMRVTRFTPLELEDFLRILEGEAWTGAGPGTTRLYHRGLHADLQAWAGSPKGLPFLLHSTGQPNDRLNEIFFLKLSALRSLFREVRSYVKAQQLPLLNLSPSSFRVSLPDVGDQFPALWAARSNLVKPGQAHPLKIKSTEQRYFIRLGRIEPSPFLPEGLGAHSFGVGSVRLRNVASDTDGTILEGTLVAEDYLGLDPNDLLWFKLPVAEERLEFYAHVYTAEAVGPREARFRTVPAILPESVVALLKRTASFARAPYEVWPLLSSPCDLHSLGIIAIRILLANSQTNLPIVVDDLLGLARHLGKDPAAQSQLLANLAQMISKEKKMAELLSPRSLAHLDLTSDQAWSQIHKDIWMDTLALLLKLFPGTGTHSFCKGFGDVSPLALETVFDQPIQELETLVARLRSVLLPSLSSNEEIASVLLEQLAMS